MDYKPSPDLSSTRDARNKPLDRDISFAHLNQVIKKGTEPVFAGTKPSSTYSYETKAFLRNL